MADIEIEGLEQILYSLDNVTDELRAKIWEHIKESAQNVRDQARSNAPKESGDLSKSIKIDYDEDAIEAIVYTKNFHAHIQEFGSVQQPAQPYLIPALEKERNPFLRGLQDVVK